MDGFSDLLSKVLADPESMSAIAGLARRFSEEKTEPAQEELPAASETLLGVPAISKALQLLGEGSRERIALLCAMRPYLREEKRARLDTVIATMKTLDLLCSAEKRI